MKETRQSNFELLRLIAMFMIVLIHANMYLSQFVTGIGFSVANGIINGICNIGVSLFVIISGYFGLKFDIKKLVRMELMMITFSLVETVVLFFFQPDSMQGRELIEQLAKSLLPFISRKYWFYSCYVVIYIFSGFVERFISAINEKEFKTLLALMLIIFSVFPTFFYFEIIPDNGKGLVQMLMIYLIGRYIRIYKDEVTISYWFLLIFVGLWVINGLSHDVNLELNVLNHHFCKDNSITNIAMAVILFMIFKSFSFKSSFINWLANPIFAVFALNNTLVNIVFEKIGLRYYGVHVELLLVTLVFIVCIILGWMRELSLKRVDKKIGTFFERIMNGQTSDTKI